jgi:hypothetical protein
VGTLALIASHDRLDVIFHNAHQGGIVVDLAHPARQLAVPHQGMASHLLPILCRKVGYLIGTVEAELTPVGLGGIPLHSILGCDGTKFGLDDI